MPPFGVAPLDDQIKAAIASGRPIGGVPAAQVADARARLGNLAAAGGTVAGIPASAFLAVNEPPPPLPANYGGAHKPLAPEPSSTSMMPIFTDAHGNATRIAPPPEVIAAAAEEPAAPQRPPISAPVVIPGGWRDGSSETVHQGGIEGGAEFQHAYADTQRKEIEAAGELGAVQAKIADAQRGSQTAYHGGYTYSPDMDNPEGPAREIFIEGSRAIKGKWHEKDQEIAKRRAQELDEQATKAEDAATQEKVDPNRAFKNMSLGQGALMGLSGALEGMLAGLQHRAPSNTAIDRMVANDIRAQEAEIAQLKDRATGLRNQAKRAASNTEKAHLEFLAKQVEEDVKEKDRATQIASKYGSELGRAQGKLAAAQMASQKLKEGVGFAKEVGGTVTTKGTKVFDMPQVIGGGGGGPASANEGLLVDTPNGLINVANQGTEVYGRPRVIGGGGRNASSNANEELIVDTIDKDGKKVSYKVATKEEAVKLRAQATATSNINDLADRAMSIRGNQGTSGRLGSAAGNLVGYTTDDRAELEAIQSKMTFEIKEAAKLGAISESDAHLMLGAIGDMNKVGSSQDIKLRALKSMFQQSLSNSMRSARPKKIEDSYAFDKTGSIAPRASYTGQNVAPKPLGPPSGFKPAGGK